MEGLSSVCLLSHFVVHNLFSWSKVFSWGIFRHRYNLVLKCSSKWMLSLREEFSLFVNIFLRPESLGLWRGRLEETIAFFSSNYRWAVIWSQPWINVFSVFSHVLVFVQCTGLSYRSLMCSRRYNSLIRCWNALTKCNYNRRKWDEQTRKLATELLSPHKTRSELQT